PQRQSQGSLQIRLPRNLPERSPHLPPMQSLTPRRRPLQRLRPLRPNPLPCPLNQNRLRQPCLSSRPSPRARRPRQNRRWSKSPKPQSLRQKRRRVRQKRQNPLRRSQPLRPPSLPSTNRSSAGPRRISRGRSLLPLRGHGVSSSEEHRRPRTSDSS